MTESLRDTLSEQVNALEETAPIDKVGADVVAESERVAVANAPVETAEQKAGRTAGRARDEQGRLLPGAAKRPPESAAQPATAAQPKDATAQVPAPAAAEVKKVNRPSSWKKDHWESFDKIATENPALAEYINQREAEFAKGVSAYKTEYDRAKPLLEAVSPYLPAMQQHGLEPAKHVQNLLNAHQTLALGTPEQRLSMFANLAKQYNVQLEQMFVRGNDGQVYLNPQLQAQAPRQQPAQQFSQADLDRMLDEKLSQKEISRELAAFAADKEKYPHFETVRPTMAGLLQAGLATDFADAYRAAIRHPNHADIFDEMQKQQLAADTQRVAEEKRRAAEAARRNQISTRSNPGTGATGGGSGKGLRALLSEAVDAHSSGRV